MGDGGFEKHFLHLRNPVTGTSDLSNFEFHSSAFMRCFLVSKLLHRLRRGGKMVVPV